jgi:hypothetical protein
MRIGPSHREVAILIVGALSRFVNQRQYELHVPFGRMFTSRLVEAHDMEKPSTQILLKALRTNLKLAIDNGVSSGPDLIASFFQTLVMSEGEVWVWKTVESVTLALRCIPSEGQPVAAAEVAVRSFATRELGKADLIASLEDYIANATADLLMLAAWNAASGSVGGEPIPVRVRTWYYRFFDSNPYTRAIVSLVTTVSIFILYSVVITTKLQSTANAPNV